MERLCTYKHVGMCGRGWRGGGGMWTVCLCMTLSVFNVRARTERQTERQTDRQTDRHRERESMHEKNMHTQACWSAGTAACTPCGFKY